MAVTGSTRTIWIIGATAVVSLGLGIGLMWMLSPDLTLYALAPYPFVIVVTLAFSHTMFKRSMEAQEALGGLAEVTQENLAGIRVVRSFGLERRERDRFERKNADLIRANMRLVIIRALMWPLLVLIGSVATVLVIYVGGSKVAEGTLTPGDLTAFLGYLAQLTWPTMALGFLVSVVQRGRASWDRVREVLEAQPDVVEAEHPLEAPREGAIVVRDLEFSRDGRKVLDGVDLEIPAGVTVLTPMDADVVRPAIAAVEIEEEDGDRVSTDSRTDQRRFEDLGEDRVVTLIVTEDVVGTQPLKSSLMFLCQKHSCLA